MSPADSRRADIAVEASSAPLRPMLDARHGAMLAEMGLNIWWQEGATAAVEAPPAAAAVPARSRAPQASGLAPEPARPAHRIGAPAETSPPPGMAAAAPVRQPMALSAPSPRPAPTVTPRQAAPRTVIPLAAVPADQAALDEAIRACSACDLGARRRQAVPGMGDPAPDWLVVGEAPGEEEDRQGLPFVGRAGQLLDRMLAAMALSRERKVYIANVIKCRPPHNRNPDPVEIAQCEPYLLRQVELLQPRILLAMGRFAAHTLLAHSPAFSADTLRQLPLGKLRGRVHEVEIAGRRLPLVVTYHPAYLLRSPAEKAKAWADLCLALDAFERLPPR